jgi:hypothetical protein
MFKDRFLAIMLLMVMVISIGRYQIPYIEYAFFKGYIAKNLCVKKEVKGNCCQGKCFLKKQIKLTGENETAKENNTNSNNKKAQTIEINEFVVFGITELNNNEITKLLFFRSESVLTPKIAFDIFVPPKHLS